MHGCKPQQDKRKSRKGDRRAGVQEQEERDGAGGVFATTRVYCTLGTRASMAFPFQTLLRLY
eukprot:3124019-Pleurochrysis_carterae.AAC.1